MAIALDLTIQSPTSGNDISFGIAHLHENNYAGPEITCSWDYAASATLTYWCLWADLHDFIEAMLGRNTVDFDNNGNRRYLRSLPHKYPTLAGVLPNLWASKIISIRGLPGRDDQTTANQTSVIYPRMEDGSYIVYYYAAITVQYEPSPWPMKSDAEVPFNEEWKRFTTIQKTPRLDFITTQNGMFRWVDRPVDPDFAKREILSVPPALREQCVDYIVTFHRCPEAFYNPADFIGFANNSDGFLAGHPQAPTLGFQENTMCLMGMQEVIKAVAFTDTVLYDFHYFFQHRPNGWDKVRRAKPKDKPPTYDYHEFSLDGGIPVDNSTRAVPLTDLSVLFQPNA